MDPILGGALITAGGGLLDSIFGFGSTSSANKTNIQIARETNQANKDIAQMNNEFNERMLERQIGYNTEMWNKQNAYNTPQAQAQRMRDAGFNPYLSGVNNTAAGNVGSITTPSATPVTMQGATVQPYTSSRFTEALGAIGSAIQQKEVIQANLDKLRADADGVRIDNFTRGAKNVSDILNVLENTKSSRLRNAAQQIINSFLEQSEQLRLDGLKQNLQQQQLTMYQQGLAIARDTIELQYLPEQLRLDVANKEAELFVKYMQGKLTQQQLRTEVWKTVRERLGAEGDAIDNQQKKLSYNVAKKTADAVAERIISEATKMKIEANSYTPDQWFSTADMPSWMKDVYFGFRGAASMIPSIGMFVPTK